MLYSNLIFSPANQNPNKDFKYEGSKAKQN